MVEPIRDTDDVKEESAETVSEEEGPGLGCTSPDAKSRFISHITITVTAKTVKERLTKIKFDMHDKPGPEVIKLFSCSTQLSIEF